SLPDPNTFGGPVKVWRADSGEWQDVPLSFEFAENSRGLGVADMAQAIHANRPHRGNGDLAYHVLDIMHAVHEASLQGQHIELISTCDRPAPMLAGEFRTTNSEEH